MASGAMSAEDVEVVSVPPEEFYVHRMVHGVQDFALFEYALTTGMNVLLEGPTGPGKTTAIRSFAAHMKMPFYAVPSEQGAEVGQLIGKHTPTTAGGFVWLDGPVTQICKHGGVLLINEVNFLPVRLASYFYSLLDSNREIKLMDHKGEIIKVHRPNCWCSLPPAECKKRWVLIAADMNPGYEGTRPLNKAFRNRFPIQVWWDYDDEVEKILIKSDPLRDFMKQLRSQVALSVYTTPVSTNMGIEFERLAKGLGYDFAVGNFVSHFEPDERESIRKLFEADRDNIEPTIETRDLTPEEIENKRLQAQYGDYDPEWKIYGINWIWEDDPNADEYNENGFVEEARQIVEARGQHFTLNS